MKIILESSKLIGAGLASISLAGSGAGIGNLFGNFILAISWNPHQVSIMFSYTILGFALTEAIALFGLMMAFLILFAF